jgi:hypothetical protein
MITIYAASDDLVEVDGDIKEEFSSYRFSDPGGAYVCVSTGDLIQFRMDEEGDWFARVIVDATSPVIGRRPDREGDEQVTITAPVTWVVATTEKPGKPAREA